MKIESIKKRHRREWLLVAVDKVDEASTTPLTGRLLAHSPHRHDIYRKLLSLKKRKKLLVEYSEDTLPKGMIAAFFGLDFLRAAKIILNFHTNTLEIPEI